jgi:hypothetical protein
MAVFVSASDENAGKNQRSLFFFGGWVAPEPDWYNGLTPAWQKQVLDGPPKIPYLHMTEIRRPEWRAQYGLSRPDADSRIDAAVDLIDKFSSLYPIGIDVNAGLFRDQLNEIKIVAASGGAKTFEPDYMCFLGYAYLVLSYVQKTHPEAERVDFVVERKTGVTKLIEEFHSHLAPDLEAIGSKHLVPLVGELIPGGKDRAPLQAADMLCWHTGRAYHPETMDADDIRRYKKFSRRKGHRVPMSEELIQQLKAAFSQRFPNKRVQM